MDTKSTIKHSFSTNIVEIVNLKYSQFVEMIKELNSIAEYFVDDDGSSLSFSISKGTDLTFLWKLTVKIECSKVRKFSITAIKFNYREGKFKKK